MRKKLDDLQKSEAVRRRTGKKIGKRVMYGRMGVGERERREKKSKEIFFFFKNKNTCYHASLSNAWFTTRATPFSFN